MGELPAELSHAFANVTPLIFHEHAIQYFEYYQTGSCRNSRSPVPYFLLCRSIELELKSRHLNAKSRKEVKNEFGHNLATLYELLPAEEKLLCASDMETLRRTSELYDVRQKGFEYVSVYDVSTNFEQFPELSTLERIAETLLGVGRTESADG